MQNRVHLFTQEGELLMYMGNKQGVLPGTFSGLQYIMIDKQNRVFTSETYPGRVQEFRYVTQEEAVKEKDRRDALKAAGKNPTAKPEKAIPAAFPTEDKPADKAPSK
jgi:hypothetical protein